ncbi:hypothetical protein N9L20_07470 [Flavobacteriaceae bacterium]|nr:hypothetical protein [Flavobacteriaceae bacterium]
MRKQTNQTTLYSQEPVFKSNEQMLMDFLDPGDIEFTSQKEFYNHIYKQLITQSIIPKANHDLKQEFEQLEINIYGKKILILPIFSTQDLRPMKLQELILPIEKLNWNLIITITNQETSDLLISTADRLRIILCHESLFMSFLKDLLINTKRENISIN